MPGICRGQAPYVEYRETPKDDDRKKAGNKGERKKKRKLQIRIRIQTKEEGVN